MPFSSYVRSPRTRCQQGSPPPAWADEAFDGRRAYIRTSLDRCIPSFAQDAMIKATRVDFSVRDFQTSHSPFLNQPWHLASTLVEIAKEYMALNISPLGLNFEF